VRPFAPYLLAPSIAILLVSCGTTPPADVQPPIGDEERVPVLLDGDPDASARDAVSHLRPIRAQLDDVDVDGFMTTRISAYLHADATVADVNDALLATGARISFMRPGLPWVTLAVERLASLAEAEALAAALVATGAFLSASPAITPVLGPPYSAVDADDGAASRLLLPGGEADQHVAHLKAIAMPSAWNLRGLAVRQAHLVPVLIADGFVRSRESTQISNLRFVNDLADEAVGYRTWDLNTGRRVGFYYGNHGWHVAGTVGADFDPFRSTGAHPGAVPGGGSTTLRIDAATVLGVGLTSEELYLEIVDHFPDSGVFVLNASFGLRWRHDLDAFVRRASATSALFWRALTQEYEERFVVAQAAGNDTGRDPRPMSAFALAAALGDVSEIVQRVEDRELLAAYLADLEATFPDVDFHRRSGNTLVVGSSLVNGTPSSFTNDIEYLPEGVGVRTVGSAVFGPCARSAFDLPPAEYENHDFYCTEHDGDQLMNGTSMAAPQVAALAAYLWNLDPTLTGPDVVSVIAATHRDGLVNAFEAALAVGGMPARLALLDVDDDGRFDEHDIEAFLTAWATDTYPHGIGRLTYSRYDLSGSGRAGGVTQSPFDLDGDGTLGPLHFSVGGVERSLDERLLRDDDILCYYAYAGIGLYTGDPAARDALLLSRCREAEPPGVLLLHLSDSEMGAPLELVELEVCSGDACERVVPRRVAPGSHVVDLRPGVAHHVSVEPPGYLPQSLPELHLAVDEVVEQHLAFVIDESLDAFDSVTILVTPTDVVSGSVITGRDVRLVLRAGIGSVDGEVLATSWSAGTLSPPVRLDYRGPAGHYTLEVDHVDYLPGHVSFPLADGVEQVHFDVELLPAVADDVLALELQATPDEVAVGDLVRFDLTVANRWTHPVLDLELALTIHGDATLVTAAGACTVSTAQHELSFGCAIDELAGDADEVMTFEVTADSHAGGSTLLALATITAWVGPEDGDTSNHDATAMVPIAFSAPARLEIDPEAASVAPRGTVQFDAVVYDDLGNVIEAPVTWSSSWPCVAAIDEHGLATALGVPGTTSVTAEALGLSAVASLHVGGTDASAPDAIDGTWWVCDAELGTQLLILDLTQAPGQPFLEGTVTMLAYGQAAAINTNTSRWEDGVLSVDWTVFVAGGDRTSLIAGGVPVAQEVLLGDYTDRIASSNHPVHIVRPPDGAGP
jgi:subtilisin family serine protease